MPGRAGTTLWAGVALLALAAAACSSGGSGGADPTLPTKPAQTTPAPTTAPADPFAIPEVIDEAYVNRVLAALDQIDGDILRETIVAGAVTFPSLERLRAIYNDPEYDQQVEALRDVLKGDLSKFKSPPGNRSTAVFRVLRGGPQCVVTKVRTDFSGVVASPPSTYVDEFQAIVLQRTQPGADPKRLNPTSWSIGHDEVLRGGEPKEELCEES